MKGDGGVNIDAAKLFNGPGQVEPRVPFFPTLLFFLPIRRASTRVFSLPLSSLFSFFACFSFFLFLFLFFFFRSTKRVRGRDKRSRGSTLLTWCARRCPFNRRFELRHRHNRLCCKPPDESRSVGRSLGPGRFRRFPSCHAPARCSFYSTNVSENHRGDEDV